MAGRFRFTPKCCCGAECSPPCLPSCREIFRGFYNQPIWLGPYDPNTTIAPGYAISYPQAVVPGCSDYVYPLDNSYVITDITDSFDDSEEGSNCIPFTVNHEETTGVLVIQSRWVARRVGTTPESDWTVRLSYPPYSIGLYGVTATTNSATIPWANANLYNGTDLDNTHGNSDHSMPGAGASRQVGNSSPAPSNPACMRVHNYDSYLHAFSAETSIYTYDEEQDSLVQYTAEPIRFERLFCLPYNICAISGQPICFAEGVDYIELESSQSSPQDFYIPISGIQESGCSISCNFDFPDECGIIIDSNYRNVFSPDGLSDYLDELATPAMADVLDYLVVRLYGFGSPVEVESLTGGSTTNLTAKSGAIAVEFACVYVYDRNDNILPVILEDISLKDCELTVANWNPDYNLPTPTGQQSATPDYPQELLMYGYVPVEKFFAYYLVKTGYPKRLGTYYDGNNRIILGEDAMNQTQGSHPIDDKYVESRIVFGSTDTSAYDGVDSVGTPSIMPNIWHSPSKSCPSWKNVNAERFNGIWWALAAVSPCNEEFPQKVTRGILESVPLAEFTADNTAWNAAYTSSGAGSLFISGTKMTAKPLGDITNISEISKTWRIPHYNQGNSTLRSLNPPYLVKPDGYELVRLLWRILRPDAFYVCNTTDPPQSTPTVPLYNGTQYLIAVSTKDRYGERPYQSTVVIPQGESFQVAANSGSSSGQTALRATYANAYNLEHFEESVNGGQYITLSDSIHTYYLPYITKQKLYQYFGRRDTNEDLYALVDAPAVDLSHGFKDVENTLYYYPCGDIQYIAVWKPDQ